MTDISDLLAPKKATVATPQRPPVRAVITSPPATLDAATMRVVVPGHSSDYATDCRWVRQGDAIPAAGVDCLVIYDETGAGTVVAWEGAGVSLLAIAAAIDVRLDALEPRHAFLAIASSSAVPTATTQKIPYTDAGGSDPEGIFDAANSRFVAPVADWYDFSASIGLPTPGAVGTRWLLMLFVNGAISRTLSVDWTAATWSNDYSLRGNSGRVLLAANDQVDVRIAQSTAGSINVGSGASSNSWFSGGRA